MTHPYDSACSCAACRHTQLALQERPDRVVIAPCHDGVWVDCTGGSGPLLERTASTDDPAVTEIRNALAEVQAMAVTLREQVGKADQLVLELTRASGEAQRYQQALAVVVGQLISGDVDGALAHGRAVLHG